MGDRSGAQEVPYDLKCGSHDQGHEGLPYGGGKWTEHAVGMQKELEQVFGLRPLYDYSHNLFLLCDALSTRLFSEMFGLCWQIQSIILSIAISWKLRMNLHALDN